MILVLGLGNVLLSDEGAGVAAMNALKARLGESERWCFLDGGTHSFALAGPIADCDALLVFDAAALDKVPGEIAVYQGEAMDAFITHRPKQSVHEVGLMDLMSLARLGGHWPVRRALIGVRPQSLDWGSEPTPVVAAAIPRMCDAAENLMRTWMDSDVSGI
ncbi:MAG: hydrogenase maturation protease [Rhodocyclaceae bacterium]|nr:hydrogenase maturation protease [Rhodocyclaceae bacterium]